MPWEQKVTDEQIEIIMTSRTNGKALAVELGLAQCTVQRYRVKLGYNLKTKPPEKPKENRIKTVFIV